MEAVLLRRRAMRSGLTRLYSIVGGVAALLSVVFAAFLHQLVRGPHRGPWHAALLIFLVILLALQTLPGAGLAAVTWMRFPELHPRAWPRWVRRGLGAALGLLLFASLFLGSLLVVAVAALPLASALIAARLADRDRRWVIGWLCASACVLAVDGVVLLWLPGLVR